MKKYLTLSILILALALVPVISVSAADPIEIPNAQMTASATSYDDGTTWGTPFLPENILDGDPDTIWHTQGGVDLIIDDENPVDLIVDLGEAYQVTQLRYVVRQGGYWGHPAKYDILVSSDGSNYTKVTDGTREKLEDVFDDVVINLDRVEARFVMMRLYDANDSEKVPATCASMSDFYATGIPMSAVSAESAEDTKTERAEDDTVAPEEDTGSSVSTAPATSDSSTGYVIILALALTGGVIAVKRRKCY